MQLTEGCLLGGRVRYAQPAAGYRTGLEPVLLAASVPARPGETVLEGGTGAGAALLCLAARVPALRGFGVERDPEMAALAARNAAANGWGGITIEAGDVVAVRLAAPVDHALANPPWHAAEDTPSPSARRDAAKRARPGLFAAWARALAANLRPRGSLTLVVPAARLPAGLAALHDAGCGSEAVLPLWPRAGTPAKLVLLRGVRGGRGAGRLLPGLVLHHADGRYTEEATAILRDGTPLAL